MALKEEDIDKIADKMVQRIQSTHHSFWIDPEQHYQDHLSIREVIGSWRSAKSIFARAFIGLVVIGTIVMALVGLRGWK